MAALAHQPADVEARMLAEDNLLPRPRPRNLAQMRRDIETTRASGYCVMPSRQVAGVTNIAAPILGYGGYAVAVIAVPHIQRIDLIVTPPPDALLVHVCDVAGNLSRLSGHIAETRATPPTPN